MRDLCGCKGGVLMRAEETVFVNLSNHPSGFWGAEQRQAAESIGRIVDVAFPAVQAEASAESVREMAAAVCSELEAYSCPVVMVQGEFTLTYHIVRILKEKGIRAVASCSTREAVETMQPDGSTVKNSTFRFVQFRDY